MVDNASLDSAKAYIAEYDRDGDGSIDYEEFMRMLLPKDAKVRMKA